MALIACPKCGHKVMSVASVCPHCSFSLSEHRVIEAHRSSGTRCANCHQVIPAGANHCPHCHAARPSRRALWWIVPPAMVVLALVVVVTVLLPRSERQSGEERAAPTRTDSAAVARQQQETVDSIPPAAAPITAQEQRSQPAIPQTVTRWTSTWVNVREERNPNSRVLQILRPGQRVEVADLQRGWWVAYMDGEMIGHVARSTLRTEPPEQSAGEPPQRF